MKQELVQLAKDKGFVATFVYDKPFIYSSKEPLRWLFWMTELQKWLRETDIYVEVFSYNDEELEQTLWENRITDVNDEWNTFSDYTFYHFYEEAFKAGLFEALKLVP